MKVVSGIDLVYLPRFKKSLKVSGENFLRTIFQSSEISADQRIEHLAGIFAAKEAVIKALELPPGSWQDIQIIYKSSGTPKVKLHTSYLILHTSSLSISHDGQYVIAQFVALLNK